jgi:Tfp pilus assembly protein PilX
MKALSTIAKSLTVIIALVGFTSFKSVAQYYNTSYNSTAESYANQVAEQKMRELSPNTGFSSYAIVKGWYYDSYSNKYYIKMEAYWKSKTNAYAESYSTAEIDGVAEINKYTLNWDFNETYRNAHLRNSWTGQDTRKAASAVTTAAAIYGLYKMFSSN